MISPTEEYNIVVTPLGVPYRFSKSEFIDLSFDIQGHLIEFTHHKETTVGNNTTFQDIRYKYFVPSDFFKDELHKYQRGLSGFFEEREYLNYIQAGPDGTILPHIAELGKVRRTAFPFDLMVPNYGLLYAAKPGDVLTIERRLFGEPFEKYRKRQTCVIILTESNYRYLANPFDSTILVPSENVNCSMESDTPDSWNINNVNNYFYQRNFYSRLSEWQDVVNGQERKDSKEDYCEVISLISINIANIVSTIFPVFCNMSLIFAARLNSEIKDSLDDFELCIYDIVHEWGYHYSDITDKNVYPETDHVPYMFTSINNYHEAKTYLNTLRHFYKQCYIIQDIVKTQTPEKNIETILSLLPPSKLSVIPYPQRIKWIDNLKKKKLTEDDERKVLKLVNSIQISEINDFLSYLIDSECKYDSNGKLVYKAESNFAILYNKLDDARLQRYPFIGWFVDQGDNRGYFCYICYKLWLNSQYNPFDSMWNLKPESDSFYLLNYNNSDFITQECIIPIEETHTNESERLGDLGEHRQTTRDGNLKTKIIETTSVPKIQISEVISETIVTSVRGKSQRNDDSRTVEHGTYHIFQPIALTKYAGDVDLKIPGPPASAMPAFLVHYVDDYYDIKIFDANAVLLIELTIEAAAFFLTGGGSSVLQGYMHFDKLRFLRQAFRGEITDPNFNILVWRAAEGRLTTVSLNAGILSSLATYEANVNSSGAERDFFNGVALFFALLSLSTGLSAGSFRSRVMSSADDIIAKSGSFANFPNDVKDIVLAVKGEIVLVSAALRTRLLGMFNSTDDIIIGFDALTEIQKYRFTQQFSELADNASEWAKLNKSATMSRYKTLLEQGLDATLEIADDIDLFNAVVRFGANISMWQVLARAKYARRIEFLKYFGDVDANMFTKLAADNVKLLQFWLSASDEMRRALAIGRKFWLNTNCAPEAVKSIVAMIDNKWIYVLAKGSEADFNDINKLNVILDWIKTGKFGWRFGDLIEIQAFLTVKARLKPGEQLLENLQLGFVNKSKDGSVKFNNLGEVDGLVIHPRNPVDKPVISCKSSNKEIKELAYMEIYTNIPTTGKEDLLAYAQSLINGTKTPRDIGNQLIAFIKRGGSELEFRFVVNGKEEIWDVPKLKAFFKNNYSNGDLVVYKPSNFDTTREALADAVLNAIQQKFKFKSFTGGKYIMGRTRIVSLLGVAHESTFHLGHMAVMTYFATLLDQTLGKKMYAILGSDCHYKSVYGLPTNGCDGSEQAYYDATIYQEVIQFIDSVVIPAIVALGDEDLLDSYGGVEEFAEKLRSSENYLHSLVLIPEEENTDYSAHNIKVLCEEISDVLKESIATSTPFNLSYD